MRLLYLLVILGTIFCLNDAAIAKHKKTHARPTKVKHAKVARPRVRTSRAPRVAQALIGSTQLTAVLSNIINNSGSSNADITVYVKSMRYGDTLYSRNIYQPLAPASTMKVMTAEAALIYLGPNYRFSTQLLTDAKSVKNGVLQGNLYIVLSGDPTLTYPDLVELLDSLRSHKIQAIAGNVYIDSTAYDQRFYGPGWIYKDKSYCYAAPISASIINHNCLSFQVAPAKVAGNPAEVVRSSKYYIPPIKNTVITKAGRSACSMRLSKDPNSIISIDGCLSKGRSLRGVSYVVTDIPEYNRSLFKSLISRLGVNVYGQVTFGSAPNNLAMVGNHASQPLRVLIKEMLKKSDNIIAGALFKKLGQLYTRKPGSWENGSLAVSQILAKHAGVNTSGLRVLDGSGLSPDNLATSSQMMQVLDFAFHHPTTSEDFVSSLPIAGVDGTLKHRMGNIMRKIRAKTGTISGVVGLAGYASSADKEQLAFVIMINGARGYGWRYKSLEDKIATALTRYTRT